MTELAKDVLDRVRRAEDEIAAVCRDLIRIPSENPPGDVTDIARYVEDVLKRWKCDVRRIEPAPGRVNLVATWDSGRPGKHLVFNGHLDTFPAGPLDLWQHDPFAGDVEEGRLYGRGAIDMKGGVTASLFAFRFLPEFGEGLGGKASLTLVCDEETFAEYGARHVLDHYPECYGDALLNGEPGARIADKGLVWAEARFQTRGGHAAYANVHENAIDRAIEFLRRLKVLETRPSPMPREVQDYLAGIVAEMDAGLGEGAVDVARRFVVTAGLLKGGTKVNMAAAEALLQVDVRIPAGGQVANALAEIEAAAVATGGNVTIINSTEPSITDWRDPFARTVAEAARAITGSEPRFALGLGCTDARLWRYRGVPAIVYGPTPHSMGGTDEYIELPDLYRATAVQALAALEFLGAG
jgi:succinyl-diaminopimelate desuccinylase